MVKNMKSEKEYTEGISIKENKLLAKLDNFWYYHKWHTLVGIFVVFVLGICIFQMCTKVDYNMTFIYAGPKEFSTSEGAQQKANITAALSNSITDLYGEDASADLHYYIIHSEDQIKELEKETDENGHQLYNTAQIAAQSTTNMNDFNNSSTFGDAYIFLLDPYIYEQLQTQSGSNERFVPLADVFGEKPDCAYDNYAIRLADTDFYKNNLALSAFPEDTLICLHQSFAFSDKTYYKCCYDTFKKIAAVSVLSSAE